jgi:hypothetical protein
VRGGATWQRVTLEELGQERGRAVLAGGDDVVAKVVVEGGVAEGDDALAGGRDGLVPRPLPLASAGAGAGGGLAGKGRAALLGPALWLSCVRGWVACEGEAALLRAHRVGRRVEEVVVVEERIHRRRISGDGGVGPVHEPGKRLFGVHVVVAAQPCLTSLLSPVWHPFSSARLCDTRLPLDRDRPARHVRECRPVPCPVLAPPSVCVGRRRGPVRAGCACVRADVDVTRRTPTFSALSRWDEVCRIPRVSFPAHPSQSSSSTPAPPPARSPSSPRSSTTTG